MKCGASDGAGATGIERSLRPESDSIPSWIGNGASGMSARRALGSAMKLFLKLLIWSASPSHSSLVMSCFWGDGFHGRTCFIIRTSRNAKTLYNAHKAQHRCSKKHTHSHTLKKRAPALPSTCSSASSCRPLPFGTLHTSPSRFPPGKVQVPLHL